MITEADIVERLRAYYIGNPGPNTQVHYPPICREVANEIVLLQTGNKYMCDELERLRAERDAAARDMVLVPKEALLWLSGAGPDADGRWFGQCEDEVIKMPRKHTPRYWWRSKFRSMIPNWPKDPPTLLATSGKDAT
jgi:hypothetical protein